MHYSPDGEQISMQEWAELFQQRGVDDPAVCWWRVGAEEIGEWRVSTVWLGMDHNFSGEGPPLIWETMIFGEDEEHQERYSTREEAVEGHERAVAHLKALLEVRAL